MTRLYVRFVLGHARLLWVLAILLAIPATWRTVLAYAHLRADFEELLPKDTPSVVALGELRERTAGLRHLGVVVDVGPDANMRAGEKFLDDLAARVERYPSELVSGVHTSNTVERAFIDSHAALFVDLNDLRSIRARIEARRDWDVSRATGTSLDDDEPAPPLDFSDIDAKYKRESHGIRGRFSSAKEHTTVLVIELAAGPSSASRGARLLRAVKADIAALGGTDAYAHGMRVGYAADVATSVEEADALKSDLSISSVLVLVAVAAVIVVYFRFWKSLIVLVVPLLLATTYAFAAASLPPLSITSLNSNTAFLGSIILGNGINFGIVLLARHVEARRAGASIEDSMVLAVSGSAPATLTAALAAGTSYTALAFTRFEGFRQFGCIGGLGMVFAWLASYVLMPSLAAKLDEGKLEGTPKPSRWMNGAAWIVRRGSLVVIALTLVATGFAVREAMRFDSTFIATDISKLRRSDTWTSGEGYWGARMNRVLGEYLTPIAILTDSPEEARAVARSLRESVAHGDDVIDRIRTSDDVVPPDQPSKLVEIDALRDDLTPRIRASLSARDLERVDSFIGASDPAPFDEHDVPAGLTIGLRDREGALQRDTVLVYPRIDNRLWEGSRLIDFVSALRDRVTRASGSVHAPRVAGSQPLTADIVSAVEHDGPRATSIALLGVIVVVLVLFRFRMTTLIVVVSLCVAVLWLLASTMAMGLKINFVDFIAFPITFGIGVDYPINVAQRAIRDGVDIAIRTTGGAVALCSLTTMIGYASLLIARNRGLRLFGLYAVLGEIACLTIAIFVVPAVIRCARRSSL